MEVQTFLRLPNDSAFKDRRAWVDGPADMILLHEKPQEKYPTEVTTCLHGRDPNALKFQPAPKRRAKDFIPPSVRPDEAWCTGCRQYHHVSKFHKDRSRGRGLQYNCIDFRAAQRIAGPHKKQVSEHWYRSPR